MEIGDTLRERRKQEGWTQEAVAEKIGVSSKSISNWETCKNFPDIESLIRLAKLYHLSLDNLLLEGSEIVKDLQEKTELNTLKKFSTAPTIVNAILILVISTQKYFGMLALPILILVILSLAINMITFFYLNGKVYTLSGLPVKKMFQRAAIGVGLCMILFIAVALLKYFF